MNWLSVTLTVALTVAAGLGVTGRTETGTAASPPIDSVDVIDSTEPVIMRQQAVVPPELEYDTMEREEDQLFECAPDCDDPQYPYPTGPRLVGVVSAVMPMELHASSNPGTHRMENGKERLYARVGQVDYLLFFTPAVDVYMNGQPTGTPYWEEYYAPSLEDYAVTWGGAGGVTAQNNGKRHQIVSPGAYSFTATVNSTFSLALTAMTGCNNCMTGCRRITVWYTGVEAPPLQTTVPVTAVGVGSLELANAGEEIDDGLTEEGEDRIVYLRERWSGPESGSGPLSAPALPSAALSARVAASVMALTAPAPADPAYAVATATPIPDVDDVILAALNWSFTGGEAIAGESEYRKRRASTLIPAVHDFVVTIGPPPAADDDDGIARGRLQKWRQMNNVALQLSPSTATPNEVLIGSRAAPSVTFIPVEAQRLMTEDDQPEWTLPAHPGGEGAYTYVKDYITYAAPEERDARYRDHPQYDEFKDIKALGRVLSMTADDLKGDSITFYWVAPGAHTVGATLRVGGQSFTGETKYTVLAPTLGVDLARWFYPDGVQKTNTTNPAVPFYVWYGVQFGLSVTWPVTSTGATLSGEARWIQLVKDMESDTDILGDIYQSDTIAMVLDNKVPYEYEGDHADVAGTVSMLDYPKTSDLKTYVSHSRDFDAVSHLMVRVSPAHIWVPAGKKVTWGYKARASSTRGTDPAGTPVVHWSFTAGTSVTPPTAGTDMRFPIWDKNWTEFKDLHPVVP